MSNEAGFYKLDGTEMRGPSPALPGPKGPMWGLRASAYKDGVYGTTLPHKGWGWRDAGDRGPGFYHDDGSYLTGVMEPGKAVADCIPIIQLYTSDKIGAWGWKWFDTMSAAYTANGVPLPPVPWTASHYKVGDKVQAGDGVYICVKEGDSDPMGIGPAGQMMDTPDGTCIWAYIP